MKVLFYDIETTPSLGYTWEKYEQNVIAFKKEWEFLSFSYKWLGDDKVYCVTRKNQKTDKHLVKKLHELLSEADVVIAHNGDDFDNKKASAKFIEYGLLPPKPYHSVDTRKVARRYFKFNSNSLNDLGNLLGVGKKVKHTGFDLWLGCMNNEAASWKLMEKYNKQDVLLLERVYDRMKPWIKNHPRVREGIACPKCGGFLQRRGTAVSANGLKKERYQCTSCGGWCQGSGNKIRGGL